MNSGLHPLTRYQQPNRLSREEREQHETRLMKYYRSGTWHGQSAAGTMYILATVLERVDSDLLWCVSCSYFPQTMYLT